MEEKEQKRKQILIKILTKLVGHRELAEGFLTLLQSEYADEQTVDELSRMIYKASQGMKASKEKDVLQKGLELVQKIKHKEAIHKEKELEELEGLDAMIENL